jgi:hypothetical protein
MILHKGELEILRDLIGQEFADEDAYLKSIATTVEGFLFKRSAWGVGVKFGETITAPFGPVYHKSTAIRLANGWAGVLGSGVFVTRLHAPAMLELDTTPPAQSAVCASCGHPRLAHNWPTRIDRGCLVGTVFPARGKPDYTNRCACVLTER